MEITIQEILTTYWSQTVLIIAGLGYLIKRLFDLRSKKIEFKQSLFQQNRIEVIMRFMDSYVKLQKIYRKICQSDFNLKQRTDDVFKQSIPEHLEELYSSFFYLRLYLDILEQTRYGDLLIEMRSIASKVSENLQDQSEVDDLNWEIETKKFVEDKLRVNNENFKVIGQMFRENSNRHYPIKM